MFTSNLTKLNSVPIIAYNSNVHFARNVPFSQTRSHIIKVSACAILSCMDLLVSVAIGILHLYHFSSHCVLCESCNVNVRESLFVKSSVIHRQLPAGGTPAQESRSDYHH